MRSSVLVLVAFAVTGCRGGEAPPATQDSAMVTIEPAAPTPEPVAAPRRTAIPWETEELQAVARARKEGRPLIVYFSAAWCAACGEMERGTFKDRKVISATERFVTLWVDAVDDESPVAKPLLSKYEVLGLPTLIAFDKSGQERTRITEYVSADKLGAALRGIE
jgi:thiol:disulfide interchange protein DsbD